LLFIFYSSLYFFTFSILTLLFLSLNPLRDNYLILIFLTFIAKILSLGKDSYESLSTNWSYFLA